MLSAVEASARKVVIVSVRLLEILHSAQDDIVHYRNSLRPIAPRKALLLNITGIKYNTRDMSGGLRMRGGVVGSGCGYTFIYPQERGVVCSVRARDDDGAQICHAERS